MQSVHSARRALFVLLVANLLVVLWVFRPLAIALFLAAVLGAALWPMQNWLTNTFRGRSRLAAVLLIIGVVLLLLAPLVTLSAFVVKEATEGVKFVSDTVRSHGVEGLIRHLPDGLEKYAHQLLGKLPTAANGGLEQTVQEQVSQRGGKAAALFGAVVVGTGTLLFQAAMMLIALFFFLTEKDRILDWVDEASPLAVGQTRELGVEFRNVSGAVLRSSVLTAGVQTIAAVVGYYMTKVPYPIFFAAVTFFFALIPAVGAASVCLFTAGLLLLGGHPFAAAFLAGWGILVVGLSDNLVKPLLIRRGVEMHGAVVFFALLGGLAAFGTIGLLLGPLAVALFIAMLRIYRRDYGDKGSAPATRVVAGSAEAPGASRVLVPRDAGV
jgi:predicted PurR-regulated permease PerM